MNAQQCLRGSRSGGDSSRTVRSWGTGHWPEQVRNFELSTNLHLFLTAPLVKVSLLGKQLPATTKCLTLSDGRALILVLGVSVCMRSQNTKPAGFVQRLPAPLFLCALTCISEALNELLLQGCALATLAAVRIRPKDLSVRQKSPRKADK